MVEKPKILVIYGYHPEEEFSIAVGESLKFHLLKHPSEKVRATKYSGINPRTVDDSIPGTTSRGRLLHEFMSQLDNIDYLFDLHDESPWPKNERERKRLLQKLPPFTRKSNGRAKDGTPGQIMFYVSKFDIEHQLKLEITDYCLSLEPEYVAAVYFIPKEKIPFKYDHLEIGYYPHLSSIKSAKRFILGLIPILQKYKK